MAWEDCVSEARRGGCRVAAQQNGAPFPTSWHQLPCAIHLERFVQLLACIDRNRIVVPRAAHARPPVDLLNLSNSKRTASVVAHAINAEDFPTVLDQRHKAALYLTVQPLPPRRPPVGFANSNPFR